MAGDDARQMRISLDERPEGIVATVTICNARRLNTMNSVLMREFIEQMAVLAANRELRALVLTGEGEKAFIGGADIKEMGLIRDAAGARAFISHAHACCAAVRSIPVRPLPASRATPWGRDWRWRPPAICGSLPSTPFLACRR